MVCTKANQTYTSDCEFFQMQCWCRKNDEHCTRKQATTDSIDYFGQCQSKIVLFYIRILICLKMNRHRSMYRF